MKNILSGFLKAGLLPIGEDDEKLKFLEAAATDLAKQISDSPLLAYPFALAGFDGRVKGTSPAIQKAETAVTSKWQTITNKIGPNPVQVYRATILRALEIASEGNYALCQALVLIIQNEPELHTQGKEHEVIEAMLLDFNERAIRELNEVWIKPVDLGLAKALGKIKKVSFGKEELAASMLRAVGALDNAGQPIPNSNPHSPDTGEEWANEFAKRASDAIYAAIQSAAKNLANDMQEAVRGIASGIEQMALRDAKSELLWMRASMYSTSARRSYRMMEPVDLMIHAALDTSRVVGPSAPPSVEYFLHDLVDSLSQETLNFSELLTAVGQTLRKSPEVEIKNSLPLSGRRPWLEVALQLDETATFEEQTGVSPNHKETAAKFAVKFYRELQIRKLLSHTA